MKIGISIPINVIGLGAQFLSIDGWITFTERPFRNTDGSFCALIIKNLSLSYQDVNVMTPQCAKKHTAGFLHTCLARCQPRIATIGTDRRYCTSTSTLREQRIIPPFHLF